METEGLSLCKQFKIAISKQWSISKTKEMAVNQLNRNKWPKKMSKNLQFLSKRKEKSHFEVDVLYSVRHHHHRHLCFYTSTLSADFASYSSSMQNTHTSLSVSNSMTTLLHINIRCGVNWCASLIWWWWYDGQLLR